MSRGSYVLIAFLLVVGTLPVRARDVSGIVGAILGEFGRQIELDQQRQLQKQIRPVWNACANGNVQACDAAATYPLNPYGRAELARMRDAAVRRPAFEQNWSACQRSDIVACNAALTFPYLNQQDRASLINWRQQAMLAAQEQTRKFNEFKRLVDWCSNGRVSACDAALQHSMIRPESREIINRKKRELEQAMLRDVARRAYLGMKTNCLEGDRDACVSALKTRFVPSSDRVLLERKRDELTPLADRVLALVDKFPRPKNGDKLARIALGLSFATLIVVAMIGLIRNLSQSLSSDSTDPFNVSATPANLSAEFPLTGHTPTDVRRVLAEMTWERLST